MRFCPECGTSLQAPNPKFCPECGSSLQSATNTVTSEGIQRSRASLQGPAEQIEEDLLPPIKLNTYDLGVQLESTTASIFEKMGYSVEKRKRVLTKSGAVAEIDVMLTRGSRRRAVECKNYDPSRSVGIQELRVFKDKLSDAGIASGVFVTNTLFSEDAQKLASSTGIELWDGDKHREMFYAYAIGRIRNPSLVQDPILPLKLDFASASSLQLRNNHAIRLFSAVLLYHPYISVRFSFHATRSDPTGKNHTMTDNGTYFVDGLDGEIINREKSVVESLTGLFRKKEERLASREDKMVAEDLQAVEPISKPVLSSSDFKVSVAEPQVTEEESGRTVKTHVVEKNKRDVRYNIRARGEEETRSFKFVPHLNEVTVRSTKLVYVPKWSFEYESGQTSFSRRFLASSGRGLEDELDKCQKCTLLRRQTVAVCEVCGRPLCEKHAYQEGRWLCEDHISDRLRQETKGTGFFSKFKSGFKSRP